MKKFSLYHLTALIGLIVIAFTTSSVASSQDGLLRIHVLDVGQGEAIFIETPNGGQILVDGGPSGTVVQRLGEFMPFWDRDIDVIIASHPHADHITGLVDVLERYEVKTVLRPGNTYGSSEFRAWDDAVRKEGAKDVRAVVGQVLQLGDSAMLTVLHPFVLASDSETTESHDEINVVMLSYGNFRMLLTGDMEKDIEHQLVLRLANALRADVLKIGHHGSKTSSSEEFLQVVAPHAAIISVGAKNWYRLPSPDVTSRLEKNNIPYSRTDMNGTVTVITDGSQFKIVSER